MLKKLAKGYCVPKKMRDEKFAFFIIQGHHLKLKKGHGLNLSRVQKS